MDMKSYVILHVSSRLLGPVQKPSGPNAPLFESNAAAPRPLRLSVLFGFEIRLQWFISLYKASQTLGPHPPSPRLGDLSVIILVHRSMTAKLRRGGIPLHKFTIEKVGVRRVCLQLQDLENDIGVRQDHCASPRLAARVSGGGPADVRGNHHQGT